MATLQEHDKQTDAVVVHFSTVSSDWGRTYRGTLAEVSDFDRVARREAALSMLDRIHTLGEGRLALLDVGCGTGDVLSGLAADAWNVYGIDLVEAMVRQVHGGGSQTRACVGDIMALPFRSASFDVVTSLGVLEYLPDWQGALRSLRRVLLPGGHLVISFPNRQSLFRKLGILEAGVLRGLRAISGNRHRGGGCPRYDRHEWTLTESMKALQQEGFKIEEVLFNTYGLKGRIGDHSRLNLAIARRMSGRCTRPSAFSRTLAWTMVFWCRR